MVGRAISMCEGPEVNAGIQNKPTKHCFRVMVKRKIQQTLQHFSYSEMLCYIVMINTKTASITQLCKLP